MKKEKHFRIKLIEINKNHYYVIQQRITILGFIHVWVKIMDLGIPNGPLRIINVLRLREAFPTLESAIQYLAHLHQLDPSTLVCTECQYRL